MRRYEIGYTIVSNKAGIVDNAKCPILRLKVVLTCVLFPIDFDKIATFFFIVQWRYLYSPNGTCGQSANASFNEECILEGLDAAGYADKYGISVDPDTNSLTFEYATLPSSYSPAYATYGTRSMVTDLSSDSGGYAMFDLLGKELTFTVDVSEVRIARRSRNSILRHPCHQRHFPLEIQVPAGMNAAIYLVSMDQMGNIGATYEDGNTNQAGWTRGVGYCDAQCPTDLNFVQGLASCTRLFYLSSRSC